MPISDGTSPSLIRTGTTNALENNVSCDMPGQILYTNWLIRIMPLSTSMLNGAISLGREGPGSCFTTTGLLSVRKVAMCHLMRSGLLSVKLCHQFGLENARDIALVH